MFIKSNNIRYSVTGIWFSSGNDNKLQETAYFYSKNIISIFSKISQWLFGSKSISQNNLECVLDHAIQNLKDMDRKKNDLSDQQLFESNLEIKNIIDDKFFTSFLDSSKGKIASCYLENILFRLKEMPNNILIQNFIVKASDQLTIQQCINISKLNLDLKNHYSFELKFKEINERIRQFNNLKSQELDNCKNKFIRFKEIEEDNDVILKQKLKEQEDIIKSNLQKRRSNLNTISRSMEIIKEKDHSKIKSPQSTNLLQSSIESF